MTTTDPYIERQPGDLLTAGDWNDLQTRIRDDIHKVAAGEAGKITRVENADNADQLEGLDLDALTAEVTRRVMEAVAANSGYRQLFRVLKLNEWSVVQHDLGRSPMVELFQLEYFKVVCAQDDEATVSWVNFYLFHSSEKRLRVKTDGGTVSLDLQPEEGPAYKIPWRDLLETYQVPYTAGSGLGDVETEFWKAFFASPNEEFDNPQYCHSPWFERCCREERTVGDLKSRGDWDDLLFQVRPLRTVNLPTPATPPAKTGDARKEGEGDRRPRPSNVAVTHFDANTLGLELRLPAVLPAGDLDAISESTGKTRQELAAELKVMAILKC